MRATRIISTRNDVTAMDMASALVGLNVAHRAAEAPDAVRAFRALLRAVAACGPLRCGFAAVTFHAEDLDTLGGFQPTFFLRGWFVRRAALRRGQAGHAEE